MDGVGHGVPHPGHGAKGVGAGPQMGDLPEEFGGVAFLLEGISLGVGAAQDLQRRGLYLVFLALARRFDQDAFHAHAAPGGETRRFFVAGVALIHHDLKVPQGGAVGDLDEGDRLGRPAGLDPALDQNVAAGLGAAKDIFDLGALHQRLPENIYGLNLWIVFIGWRVAG